jgi:antirestriction protein ArdC
VRVGNAGCGSAVTAQGREGDPDLGAVSTVEEAGRALAPRGCGTRRDALVRIDRRDDDPKLDYATEEVVVESVAYSVCASLGLDSSGSSVPYVAGWAEGVEGDPIEAYAELIDRLARRVEEVLCR